MDRDGGEITQEEEKVRVQPMCCCGIDEDKDKVIADLEIPGVEKKDIEVRAFEDGFRLKVPKRDLTYWGVYHVGCKIDPTKTEATYQNGILHLEIPVIQMPNEAKIKVS